MAKKIDKEVVDEVKYVSINVRVFAMMIDSVIIFTLIWLLYPVLKYLAYFSYVIVGITYNDISAFNTDLAQQTSWGGVWNSMVRNHMIKKYVADIIVSIVVYGAFIVPFWMIKQSTPGKMFINAKIVDAETLEKPAKMRMLLRYVCAVLSALPLFLGVLWGSFNKKRQCWHDKVAGTAVIYIKKPWYIPELPRLSIARVFDFYKDLYKKSRKK